MINIEKNISLLPYNTFGIQVAARFFCKITTVPQLQELVDSPLYKKETKLILGGGSNILFTKDFQGLVVHMELKGIQTVTETDEQIRINVGAGESRSEEHTSELQSLTNLVCRLLLEKKKKKKNNKTYK